MRIEQKRRVNLRCLRVRGAPRRRPESLSTEWLESRLAPAGLPIGELMPAYPVIAESPMLQSCVIDASAAREGAQAVFGPASLVPPSTTDGDEGGARSDTPPGGSGGGGGGGLEASLQVIALDAFDDIAIYRRDADCFRDPGDPDPDRIWTRGNQSNPVADASERGLGKTRFDVTVAAGTAVLTWSWQIPGTGLQGQGRVGITPSSTKATILVTMPESVGQWDLSFDFTVTDSMGQRLDHKQVTVPLYTTLTMPKIDKPDFDWIDRSTDWARGATTEEMVVDRIFQREVKQDWALRPFDTRSATIDGVLVRGEKLESIQWGRLVQKTTRIGSSRAFADVWSNLSKVLGVETSTGTYVNGGMSHGTFLTKKDLVSMDNMRGIARPDGPETRDRLQQYDRWILTSHTVGIFRGAWYDPTFNRAGDDVGKPSMWSSLVEANQVGWNANNGVMVFDRGFTARPGDANRGNETYNTWAAFEYLEPSVPPRRISALAKPADAGGLVVTGLPCVDSGSRPSAGTPARRPDPIGALSDSSALAFAAIGDDPGSQRTSVESRRLRTFAAIEVLSDG